MQLILNRLVENCSSNVEGVKLLNALEDAWEANDTILIVANENAALSSSFLNSSIGAFIEKYGLDVFRSKIKFKGSKTQFGILSTYIKKHTELCS